MKHIQIALIALLFCSFTINATKIISQSRTSTHLQTQLSFKEVFKYLRSFVIGVAMSLAGDGNGLYVCIPAPWRSHPASADNPDGKTLSSFGTTGKKIIDIVGSIIGKACKFKKLIMKFVGGRRRLLVLRNRLFLLMTGRNTWGFKKLKNKIKKGVSKVAHGVKKAANKVVSAAKGLAAKIGQAALEAFKKVTGSIKNIISKVQAFFKSPFFQKLIAFFKCAMTKALPALKSGIKVVKGFIKRVKDLAAGPAGWIKFIIDMICNFKCFTHCVDYLIKAIRGNGKGKAEDFGRFFGKLVYCVGSA